VAVYTGVSTDELSAFLAHYDVGEPCDFRGIVDGAVNSNFYVSTVSLQAVLTLFEQLHAAEIPYFLSLMAWLNEKGVASPHPIAGRDGAYLRTLNGRPAAMFQRLHGAWVANPNVEHFRAVGRALGRLHAAAVDFPDRRANPYGHPWWRSAGQSLLPEMPGDQAAILREELRFQSLYRFGDLPRGTIHGDLFRDNVLFEENRIAGIIDFYFACDELLLFDVAITVNDWCSRSDGALDWAPARALLDAYHGERALTPVERGAWPAMLRAAALRWWLSRLLDARGRQAGQLGREKDPREFERVLRSRVANHDQLHGLFPDV